MRYRTAILTQLSQQVSPKESEQLCLDVHAHALRAGAGAHYARAQYTTRGPLTRSHVELGMPPLINRVPAGGYTLRGLSLYWVGIHRYCQYELS